MPTPARVEVREKTATIEALERTLLANRDDTANWLVSADALLAQNDPRGEVISLGERLSSGTRDPLVAARYAVRCRAARWPRGAISQDAQSRALRAAHRRAARAPCHHP
jgi:uncharacterized protein (TIGR02996 family)